MFTLETKTSDICDHDGSNLHDELDLFKRDTIASLSGELISCMFSKQIFSDLHHMLTIAKFNTFDVIETNGNTINTECVNETRSLGKCFNLQTICKIVKYFWIYHI